MAFSRSRRLAYVVPLHSEGQPPQSYLVALSTVRAEASAVSDAIQWLAAFVVGFGAPWRKGADVTVVGSEESQPAALPDNILLRDVIAGALRSEPQSWLPYQALLLNTGRGTIVWREDVPERRRNARAGESWYPEGPIWKGARTLILVDLDEHKLALAETAARCALGDWWTAAGQSPTYRSGQVGRAQEWDSTTGQFRSPQETRERLERERENAARRIATARDHRFSTLFTPRERRSISTALHARARQSGLTARGGWRAARQEAVRKVAAEIVPDRLGDFHAELASEPVAPEVTLRRRFPGFLHDLQSGARWRLVDLLADTLLGTARRQRWFGLRARPSPPVPHAGEEFAIGSLEREARLAKLNPTPLEQDLIDALEHRIPLTKWALEQKMPLSAARRLLRDLRLKARDTTS